MSHDRIEKNRDTRPQGYPPAWVLWTLVVVVSLMVLAFGYSGIMAWLI
jgi:hypothetical protein